MSGHLAKRIMKSYEAVVDRLTMLIGDHYEILLHEL